MKTADPYSSDCLDDSLIERFNRNLLDRNEESRIEAHLDSCESCLQRATDGGWGSQSTGRATSSGTFVFEEPECRALKDELRLQIANMSAALAGTLTTETTTFDVQLPTGLRTLEFGREIGRGKMGAVYRARQVLLDRQVAVKVLATGRRLDDERRARMIKEARAVARLSHPNIVQAYDVTECEMNSVAALFVMELVADDAGRIQTLESRLKTGAPFTARAAVDLVETLCGAVQHAHDFEIVHRDLKPANILLGRGGVPKIADFGIATVAMRHYEAGAAGTPLYMAPEQWRIGPPRRESDVYALGAILYELLSGVPPFVGNLVELKRRILFEKPADLRLVGVPADLAAVVDKCLAKDPDHRYRSAAALADDLRRFLQGRPVSVRTPAYWERPVYAVRRRPVVLGMAAVSIASLSVALFVAMARPAQASQQLESALVAAEREIVRARLLCEKGDLSSGLGVFVDALELLPSENHERRAYVDACLDHWSRRLPTTEAVYRLPGQVTCAAEDSKRRFFLSGDVTGVVHQVFFERGRPPSSWRLVTNPVSAIAVSPDGGLAAAAADGEVGIVDLSTATVRASLKAPRLPVAACVFLRRGKAIATASRGDVKAIRLWDSATGEQIPFDCRERGEIDRWCTSADGSLAAASFTDGRCWVWDGETATPLAVFDSRSSAAVPAAILGDRIYTGGSRLGIWDRNGNPLGEVGIPSRTSIKQLVVEDERTLAAVWKNQSEYSLQSWRVGENAWFERVWNAAAETTDSTFGRCPSAELVVEESGNVRRFKKSWTGATTFCVPDDLHCTELAFQNGDEVVSVAAPGRNWSSIKRKGMGSLLQFNCANGVVVRSVGGFLNKPPLSIAVSGGIPLIAYTYMLTGEIHLESVAGETRARVLAGHSKGASSLSFNVSGNRLLSGGPDRTIRLWDVKSGNQIGVGEHAGGVTAVAFSQGGEAAVSTDATGKVRLWIVGRSLEPAAEADAGFHIHAVAISDAGDRLIVGGENGKLSAFRIGDRFMEHERSFVVGGAVRGLCFQRGDSEFLVAFGAAKDSVVVHDARSLEPIGPASGVGQASRLHRSASGRTASIRNQDSVVLENPPPLRVRRSVEGWRAWIASQAGRMD